MDQLARSVHNRRTACYRWKMAESITQRELRNDSGEIMRRLDQGESFIVTRNGVPVGELTPMRRHRFVTAASAVAIFRNAPAIDPGRCRFVGWPGHFAPCLTGVLRQAALATTLAEIRAALRD